MNRRALFQILAVRSVQLVAALAAALLTLGYFGGTFWIFDLFSHFRAQYCGALIVFGLALLLLRRKKSGTFSLAAGLVLAATFLPSPEPTPAPASFSRLKIVSFNVLKTNPRRDEIRAFLEAENADLIVLSEMTDIWRDGLDKLGARYPYSLSASRDRPSDVMILSRYPFRTSDAKNFRKRRWTEVSILKEGVSYRIVGAHTSPPTSLTNSIARNRQLLDLADNISGQPRTILCGDLNITPFSPWFSEMLTRSGLRAPARGFSPTWMCAVPFIAVPIDHILLSQDLQFISRRVGPSLGSDHSPIIVEIAPNKSPQQQISLR